jgi:O-acetyl-ADP-ribose deacetylase (regulator of RNase III)
MNTHHLRTPTISAQIPEISHLPNKRRHPVKSGSALIRHPQVEEIQKRNIQSIAMSAIGAGLGGLPWIQVRGLIETAMIKLDAINIIV